MPKMILPNWLAAAAVIPASVGLCWYLTKLFGPLTLAERQWAQNARLSGSARLNGDFAEEQYFAGAIRWHFALAVLTLIATTYVVAPYGGRLGSKNEKSLMKRLSTFSVASGPAWFLQELPTLIAAALTIIPAFLSWYAWPREMVKYAAAPFYDYISVAAKVTTMAPLEIFQQYSGVTFYPTILLFVIHYIHRTLIFPFFFKDGRGHLTRWSEAEQVQQRSNDIEKVLRNTYTSSGVGGTVLENERVRTTVIVKKTRSNPLLTVALAAGYCALNGCLQMSANIASTTSQLLSPAYVGDLAGNVDTVPQSAWLFFNWPMRALIRSVGGKSSTTAIGVATSTPHAATKPLEFIFGEFFGFSHIAFPTWFLAGTLLFFFGMWINVTFDYYMFSVAKRKDKRAAKDEDDYILPAHPWFQLVTAPNYLGELIEWTGYAIALWGASGSTLSFAAGLSFAFYTFCNLAPRAVASRSWYKEKFGKRFTTEHALLPYIF